MPTTYEPIYVASNSIEAHLLRNALADEGIEAEVTNEPLQGGLGELPFYDIAPRVVVRGEDAERARQIVAQFKRPHADVRSAETGWRGGVRTVVQLYLLVLVGILVYGFAAGAASSLGPLAQIGVGLGAVLAFLIIVVRLTLRHKRAQAK